jgi:hypothetical protein
MSGSYYETYSSGGSVHDIDSLYTSGVYTIHICEKADSGESVTTRPPSLRKIFICTGCDDIVTVEETLKAELPETVTLDGCILHRKTISIQRSGKSDDVFEATCEWGLTVAPIQFNTAGGTVKITQPLARLGRYPSPLCGNVDLFLPEDAPIGLTTDGEAEGCEITCPIFSWSESYEFNISYIDFAYAMTLYGITGCVNLYPFRGFAAGEVLFMGANGGRQKDSIVAEITFEFQASPNATGLSIPPITGIAKGGWDYLWVVYSESDTGTGGRRYKAPMGAIVDRVYRQADFSVLGIGTT